MGLRLGEFGLQFGLFSFESPIAQKEVVMSQAYDFERAWLAKFSGCLEEFAGAEIRDAVMAGSES
jgi:hypothetical protein